MQKHKTKDVSIQESVPPEITTDAQTCNTAAQQTAKEKSRVATLSVISNSCLTTSKLIVGFLSGSVSIFSEGIHSGIDLLAACIALFAVKQSAKPADSRHAYGHGKFENLAGTIEALLIFIAVVFIVNEAVQKIFHIITGNSGEVGDLALSLGLIVMGGSAVVNIVVSTLLMRVAKRTDSVALEADAMHLRTDVYTSAGVFFALLIIRFTGWHILDPIIALFVAALILKAAYDLLKKAFFPLVDISLPKEETQIITEVLALHDDKFVEFHDLRTRKAGADRHVDLHLVVPKFMSVAQMHEVCDEIEFDISKRLRSTHILIHAEPCSIDNKQCPYETGSSDSCQHCNSQPQSMVE